MTPFEQALSIAIPQLQSVAASTFIWQGVEYDCIPSNINGESAELSEGGFGGNEQTAILVSVYDSDGNDLFGGIFPEKGDAITYDNTEYEIDRVSKNGGKTMFFRLYLVLPRP